MQTIYYTVTDRETGLFLTEAGAVQKINAPNASTDQAPVPLYGKEAIEQRLEEMRPDARFQRILLDTPDFWRKVSEIRPACTIDEDPDNYQLSWDNE
jgi:hypothetical protein